MAPEDTLCHLFMHSWIFLFCIGCFNITSWTGVSPVGRLLCILPIPLDADWHSWRCATFIFYFSFLLPLSLWTGLLPFLVLRLLIFLKQFNCLLTYFCQETETLFLPRLTTFIYFFNLFCLNYSFIIYTILLFLFYFMTYIHAYFSFLHFYVHIFTKALCYFLLFYSTAVSL